MGELPENIFQQQSFIPGSVFVEKLFLLFSGQPSDAVACGYDKKGVPHSLRVDEHKTHVTTLSYLLVADYAALTILGHLSDYYVCNLILKPGEVLRGLR